MCLAVGEEKEEKVFAFYRNSVQDGKIIISGGGVESSTTSTTLASCFNTSAVKATSSHWHCYLGKTERRRMNKETRRDDYLTA